MTTTAAAVVDAATAKVAKVNATPNHAEAALKRNEAKHDRKFKRRRQKSYCRTFRKRGCDYYSSKYKWRLKISKEYLF